MLVGAVEDGVYGLLGQLADGGLEGAAVFLADGLDLPEYHRIAIFAQGQDAAGVD